MTNPDSFSSMSDPITATCMIASYLIRILVDLPKIRQSFSSISSGEAEKNLQHRTSFDSFKKADLEYHKNKLILDQRLLDLERKKQVIDRDNDTQRIRLQELELELSTEISAKRFELMKEFQRQNVASKLEEIKLDWDSKNNWFSKINRIESEQILGKYAYSLLILTSPPQISKDVGMASFRGLDFDLEMRNLGDFIHKNYSSKNGSHPVKYFSNFFREAIGQIEIEQLHHLFNKLSTFIIYSDITAKEATFRLAYWSINEQLEFFSEPLKWNWKAERDRLLSNGQSETDSIDSIRDIFVNIHKVLTAFCIDFYYLSIDPFYRPRITTLEQGSDFEFALSDQLTEKLLELRENNYSDYVFSLQTTQESMNSSKDQASTILRSLQVFFSDRPEVLRLLDPLNLDPDRVAGEVILENYRKDQGFASPVNFYATGKTGAGKSSLGNTLLGGHLPAMKSTGHRDCTSALGMIQFVNNLRYFDLPGAGSNQEYENINRAILCMEQLAPRRGLSQEVSNFNLHDYTNSEKIGRYIEKTIPTSEWQSNKNQLKYGADIILYVIAPHQGVGREDENYMEKLLLTQKEKRGSSNVVFALNLHTTNSGEPKYTPEYLEDAKKAINETFSYVFPDEPSKPVIIEINSQTGLGVDKVTEQICNLLPADKLGKMEEVLGSKLKEKARIIRSKKFRQALIFIASRLATYKVDQTFDLQSDIVLGSYAAVYSYSLKVFHELIYNEENVYDIVSDFAGRTKDSRTENISIKEPIIETIERFINIPEPIFEEKEELNQVIFEGEEIVTTKRTAWGGLDNFIRGPKIDKVKKPIIIDTKTKRTIPIGTKYNKVSDGFQTVITGYNDKVVSLRHLQGGYEIIQGILAIGLGIELLQDDDISNFNHIYNLGEKEVNHKIGHLKTEIEKFITFSNSKKAEQELIGILTQALN